MKNTSGMTGNEFATAVVKEYDENNGVAALENSVVQPYLNWYHMAWRLAKSRCTAPRGTMDCARQHMDHINKLFDCTTEQLTSFIEEAKMDRSVVGGLLETHHRA